MAETRSRKPRDIEARITDEDIERARQQIGVPQRRRVEPFNLSASVDSMRHFAFGLAGDDNPLWHEPEYAASTRWRGLVAHPMFIQTMGLNETPPYPPEVKPLFRGLFRGVGKYLSGTAWTFYQPVFPGDVAYEEYTTHRIEVKQSSFADGTRSVIDTYRALWVDRAGAPIATRENSLVNAERGASAKAGKNIGVGKHVYTPDDIARIDEIYAAEQRRGADKRYWEDVEVGDELTPVAKGPLTVVDLVCRHIATGMADGYDVGPTRYAWRSRRRMPAFYTADDWGVPQVAQRVHWDEQRAQDLGLPTGYDYAIMRFAWMIHLVTNWMGDDAWLHRYSVELRKFNYLGDLQICGGDVVNKTIENGRPAVELALRAVSQRGETTTLGAATVLLPSREFGPVVLPEPPLELRSHGAMIMDRRATAGFRA
jgi:acyl dehydratase